MIWMIKEEKTWRRDGKKVNEPQMAPIVVDDDERLQYYTYYIDVRAMCACTL